VKPSVNIIGNYLRAARANAGMTQRQLGKRLGYRGRTCSQIISNWERGVASPPIAKLPRLARALGITSKEMLFQLRTSELLALSERMQRVGRALKGVG
jgi:transcriptional regulator with XRE-family HTH domain